MGLSTHGVLPTRPGGSRGELSGFADDAIRMRVGQLEKLT